MCDAVRYRYAERDHDIHFAQANAKLPVLLKTKQIELLPWGRRPRQAGQLPLGGCARLDAVYAGVWDRWSPVAVKIPAAAFLQKTVDGRLRWHEIMRGNYLQGLVARESQEQRLYVVTLTPEMPDSEYDRWPRLIKDHGEILSRPIQIVPNEI